MRRFVRCCLAAALLASFQGVCSAASAAETDIELACSEWPAEVTGQVEARLRASLLVEGVSVQAVVVTCGPQGIEARVRAEQGEQVRPVLRRGGSLEDDVVQAVDDALHELARPPAVAPAIAAEPTSKPPAEPAPAPVAPAPAAPAPPRPVVSPPSPSPFALAEVSLRGVAERWSDEWAGGGNVSLLLGTPRLAYGVSLGGRLPLEGAPDFDTSEWSAAARVQLTLRELGGLRGSVGIGASSFSVSPASDVSARSATVLSAAFLELEVSRPFWFGPLAISPGVGARLFSAERRVRLDDVEQLALPVFAPGGSLSLSYSPL